MMVLAEREVSDGLRRRTQGFRVIQWIEQNCVHTNGEWIGKPFRLLPWQQRLILELFEVDENGRRVHRWAYISVPKKNGKTELAAALGLYLLMGDDEPSPLVVCAAASDDQADLVFGAAKKMCEQSETLKQLTEGSRFGKEITVTSVPGAKLKRVAAVAGTNDGQNIHAVICDELHEWSGPKGENVWTVLTNGTVGRNQPMVIQITTAGFDRETICFQQYQHAQRVLSGEVDDPTYYAFIVEAPRGAVDPETGVPARSDHRDPLVWEAANPSYGVLVHAESIADQLSKKPEPVFRRYFLNEWTESDQSWLPPGAWEAAAYPPAKPDRTLPLVVSVDLGLKHDGTAVILTQRQGAMTRQWKGRIWENPFPPTDPRHDEWHFELNDLEGYLRDLYADFPIAAALKPDSRIPAPGPAFYLDPWQLRHTAEVLRGEGLNILEVPQWDKYMVPACQTYRDLILAGRLQHDGDPAFARHIANAVIDEKPRGWRLEKPAGKARLPIDAAEAGAVGAHYAQIDPPKPLKSSDARKAVGF